MRCAATTTEFMQSTDALPRLLKFGAIFPETYTPEAFTDGQVHHQGRVDIVNGAAKVIVERYSMAKLRTVSCGASGE